MTNHSCPHRLPELATYSDYFPLDTTEWSSSKPHRYAPKIKKSVKSVQMQRSSTVVQEVAHFTKCNSSPNVIADTASIPSVRKRKKKNENEEETKWCFTKTSARVPALPHNHNYSFHASHENQNNKSGCPIWPKEKRSVINRHLHNLLMLCQQLQRFCQYVSWSSTKCLLLIHPLLLGDVVQLKFTFSCRN